jgi:hypothetical protein
MLRSVGGSKQRRGRRASSSALGGVCEQSLQEALRVTLPLAHCPEQSRERDPGLRALTQTDSEDPRPVQIVNVFAAAPTRSTLIKSSCTVVTRTRPGTGQYATVVASLRPWLQIIVPLQRRCKLDHHNSESVRRDAATDASPGPRENPSPHHGHPPPARGLRKKPPPGTGPAAGRFGMATHLALSGP